jgi:hypothetical protein
MLPYQPDLKASTVDLAAEYPRVVYLARLTIALSKYDSVVIRNMDTLFLENAEPSYDSDVNPYSGVP